MKQKVLSFVLMTAMLLGVATSTMAGPVSVNQAKTAATTFLKSQNVTATTLIDITSTTGYNEFYVFLIQDGGFVIVSADDCVTPILGFSATADFSARNMPDNVKFWLDVYEDEIRDQRTNHGDRTDADWTALIGGQTPQAPYTTAVNALMTTTWNQSPYYNELCPWDSEYNVRTVTGCVATATSQIMKYHNWPTTGYGSYSYHPMRYDDYGNVAADYGTLSANFGATTYDWANMPNELTSTSSDAEVNAVATLMYHVGIADGMMYGPSATGGSGSWNTGFWGTSSQNSLARYFKYCPDMSVVYRDNNSQFNNILKAELDASRPILFSGRDASGGHSFVIDGYDNDGLFHVNWGWGGSYDGYFVMGDLNPAGSGIGGNSSSAYNYNNHVLLRIRPNNAFGGSTTITSTAANATVYGAGTYAFGDTIQLTVNTPEGYYMSEWADHELDNSRLMFSTGGSYTINPTIVQLGGDTMGYCGERPWNTGFGSPDTTLKQWGIRIPASVLSAGKQLSAAQLYVGYEGEYTVNIYSNSISDGNLVYTETKYIDESGWRTFVLANPYTVNGSESLYITFSTFQSGYPMTVCKYSGSQDGLYIYDEGEGFNNYAEFGYQYTFMIRGLFGELDQSAPTVTITANTEQLYIDNPAYFTASIESASDITGITWTVDGETYDYYSGNEFSWSWLTPGTKQVLVTVSNLYDTATASVSVDVIGWTWGDTMSYCGDNDPYTGYGYGDLNNNWGVKFPATTLEGRNSLTDVMFYAAYAGNYNVSVFQAYDWENAPQTDTLFTQNLYVDELATGWQIITLPSALTIDHDKSLWVMLHTTDIAYSAIIAQGGTDRNGSWFYRNGSFRSMQEMNASYLYYFMIKAVAPLGNQPGDTTVVVTCDPQSLPFSCGFEANESLECWKFVDADGDGHNWYATTDDAHGGSSSLTSESYASTVLYPDNFLISPAITLSGDNLSLSYWIKTYSSSWAAEHIAVYIVTDTAISAIMATTPVEEYTLTADNVVWAKHSIPLEAYVGQTVHLVFRHYNCSNQYYLFLDDVTVGPVNAPEVTLFAPEGNVNVGEPVRLHVTSLGDLSTMTYTWTSTMATAGNAIMASDADSLVIVYSATGTDTITVVADNSYGSDFAMTTINVVDISAVATMPYSTGFEDGDDVNWLLANGTNGWHIGTAANNGGTNSLYISNDGGITNSYNNSVSAYSYAYRTFNLSAGEYNISFDWQCYGENNYDFIRAFVAPGSTAFVADQSISNLSYNTLPEGFIPLDGGSKLNLSSGWNNNASSFTISEDGTYFIVFYWRNDGSVGTNPPAAIDNVMVSANSCPAPTALTLDNAELNELTFHWTPSGNESSWEVTVGDNESVVVYETSYTATGLEASHIYNVKVRAICAEGDTSLVTSDNFNTRMAFVSELPFTTGFEENDNNAWLMSNGANAWMIGTDANNGGSRSLYVSEDGSHNTYNKNLSSDSYAFFAFELDAGNYTASFDYMVEGENNYDYLRAFVCPATMTPSSYGDSNIYIDGGNRLQGQSSWTTLTNNFSIETSGEYIVVFHWHNDASVGNNPPAAIDNFSLNVFDGDTGTATLDVVFHGFEPPAATFSTTMGEHTAFYYLMHMSDEQAIASNLITEEEVVEYCNANYTPGDGITNDLENVYFTSGETYNTIYNLWGLPYNSLNTLGNVVHYRYMLGAGLIDSSTVYYAIDAAGVNGIVTGSGSYPANAYVRLTAEPNNDYVFTQWSDGNTDNPRIVTVTGDATYTAIFDVPVCDPIELPFTCNFDNNSDIACWTFTDADGDSLGWTRNGNVIASESYNSDLGALTPDNWMVTPQLVIPTDGATLSFYVMAYNSTWNKDKYSVYVSTTGNTPADFTDAALLTDTVCPASYTQMVVDLSAYAGQNVYIAFRHYDCTDQWKVMIDDVEVTAGAPAVPGDAHVDITVVPGHNSATIYTAMNSHCTEYRYRATANPIEYYLSNYGYDNARDYIYDYGTVYYSDDTITYNNLSGGHTYYVYVLAMNGPDDYGNIDSASFVPLMSGGTGTATMDITVSDITTNSALATYTMGDQTTNYHMFWTRNGGYTVEDAIALCDSLGWTPGTGNGTWQMTNLTPNTTYYLWCLPYNINGELGTYVTIPFTTLQQGDTGTATIEGAIETVTENLACFSINMGESTSYYLLLNASTDDCNANGWTTAAAAATSGLCYVLNTNYYNVCFNVIAGTQYELWLIPYNVNDEMGEPVHLTYTTLDAPVTSNAHVYITAEPDINSATIYTTMNSYCTEYHFLDIPNDINVYLSAFDYSDARSFILDYGMTFYSDTNITFTDLTGGQMHYVYVLAMEDTADYGNIDMITYVPLSEADTGLATLDITFSSFEAPATVFSTTMGEHTAYYHLMHLSDEQATAYNLTTEEEMVNYCNANLTPDDGITYDLDNVYFTSGEAYNTIYNLWGLPYNGANTLGTVVHYRYMLGAGLIDSSTVFYAIDAAGVNGIVTGAGSYPANAYVQLTAVPGSGYTFTQWSDGNTDNPRLVTVTGDATYTAIFNTLICDPLALPFTCGFEADENLDCWNFIDGDGDSLGWTRVLDNNYAHNGNGLIVSESYNDYLYALTPDNWMVTPQLVIPTDGATLSFYVKAYSGNWNQDKYSVYVSTTGNTPADFTDAALLTETTCPSDYTKKIVDLSAYAGQNVYIAFRHYDCTDQWKVMIDDVEVTAGAPAVPGDAHVDITAVPGINSATIYTAMNSHCTEYRYRATANPIEYYLSNYGYDNARDYLFDYGAVFYSDSTINYDNLTGGHTYYIYVLAMNGPDDYGNIDSVSFVPLLSGGTGTATIDITVTDITTNSALATYTMGDQTTNYHMFWTRNGGYTVEDAIALCDSLGWTPTTGDGTWQMTGLMPNTTYYLWCLPYNINGELGTYVTVPFTTLTIGDTGTATIEGMIESVEEDKVYFTINMGESTSYYLMLNETTDDCNANGWTTAAAVAASGQCYTLTLNYDNVYLDGLVAGTQYEMWLIPYNVNDEMGEPVHLTYTTAGGVATSNAHVAITAVPGINSATVYTAMNSYCTEYRYLRISSPMQDYLDYYGYDNARDFIYDYGSVHYSDDTINHDNLTGGHRYTIYVLAMEDADDYGNIDTVSFVPLLSGGTGTATMDITVTDITTNSALATYTMGDQTTNYHLFWTLNGEYTVEDAEAVCESNGWTPSSGNGTWQMTGLTPNTTYYLWCLPYNINGELGTYVTIPFTTLQQGDTGTATIEGVIESVEEDRVFVTLNMGESTSYYLLLNETTDECNANGWTTAAAVAASGQCYTLTLNYDNVYLDGLVAGTQYEMWLIPYNINDEMGVPVHLTYTTPAAPLPSNAHVDITAVPGLNSATIHTTMNSYCTEYHFLDITDDINVYLSALGSMINARDLILNYGWTFYSDTTVTFTDLTGGETHYVYVLAMEDTADLGNIDMITYVPLSEADTGLATLDITFSSFETAAVFSTTMGEHTAYYHLMHVSDEQATAYSLTTEEEMVNYCNTYLTPDDGITYDLENVYFTSGETYNTIYNLWGLPYNEANTLGTVVHYRYMLGAGLIDSSTVFYDIDAGGVNGIVTGSGSYPANAYVQLVAVPDSGYTFTQWSDGNTYNPRIVTVTGDATYTAIFNTLTCDPLTLPFTCGFEADDNLDCWNFIDGDGDGDGWTNMLIGEAYTHDGIGMIGSASYNNSIGPLTPDNWMVTPQLVIPAAGATLTFYVKALDTNYNEDKYSVYVSTTGNTVADFTGAALLTETSCPSNYTLKTIDLSAYAGQNIYIGFRHYDCTDAYYVLIDDIEVNINTSTTCTITVLSSDNSRGSVTGGGTYHAGDTVTIAATAFDGYHFSNWNDGNTDNPRTIVVTGNATYIATFGEDVEQYTITVISANESMGTVEGSGTYNEGSTATIRAIPNEGYVFVRWNDGNTDNPRTITVSSDSLFIANFEEGNGIDDVDILNVTVYPNPTTGVLNIDADNLQKVEVLDATGRLAATFRTNRINLSDLASGSYMVRITTSRGVAIRRVILK